MTTAREPADSAALPVALEGRGEFRSVSGLTRREVIALLSSIAATGLVGCGSGSPTRPGTTPPPPPPPPPGPPAGLTQVTGSVALPSGSTLSLSSLSLKVMGQSVALTGSAIGAIGVAPDAPTLAMVTDANGNGILAGFIDGSLGGSQAITAQSTGVVLTWFLAGGPFLPPTVKSQVLAMLTADPAMTTLGSVMAQRIAANPLAVAQGDAQIATALSSALSSLAAGGGGSVVAPSARQANPPILAVTPVTDQGGVSVSSDNTIVGVDLANSYQRPLMVYVYETQTNTGGTVTDVVPAKLIAGPIPMGEPTQLTAVGGIAALLGLSVPFRPFTINPIPLALDGASDATTYEVVVLGPSANGVIPPFFSAPRYAAEVAGWNAQIDQLFYRTWYVDLVYAFLLELTGFASVLPTSPNLVAAGPTTQKFSALPFSGSGGTSLPPSLSTLTSGATTLLQTLGATSGLTSQYQGTASSLMSSVNAQVLNAVNSVDWQASLKTGTNFVNKLASPFAGYQSNKSISKLFNNLANADRGVLWTAVVDKAQVSITPANSTLSPGEQVALTVVLSPDLISTYEFDWSTSSTTATLSAVGETNQGSAINTQKLTVDLQTTSADTTPIVVTVAVYDLASGHRTFLNRASVTVTMLQHATLTPATVVLAAGDQQTFTVAVSGTLPPGAKYVWSVTGGSGSIGGVGNVTTTVPNIAYTAVTKGTDTLSVQVADSTNHLLAKASATIDVDPDAFIRFTIAGTWLEFGNGPQNGAYTFAGGDGGRFQNAAPGLDAIILTYGLVGPDQSVAFEFTIAAGAPFTVGELFTHFTVAPQHAGLFQISLAMDFNNVGNAGDTAPNSGTGTATIDAIDQLSDGTFVVQYSFSIQNGIGGTLFGNGAGQFE
jgi:hypothetical protein